MNSPWALDTKMWCEDRTSEFLTQSFWSLQLSELKQAGLCLTREINVEEQGRAWSRAEGVLVGPLVTLGRTAPAFNPISDMTLPAGEGGHG